MEIREKIARAICEVEGINPDCLIKISSHKYMPAWKLKLVAADAALQVLVECEWPNPDKEPQSCHDFHVGYAKDCIKSIQQGGG